MNTYEEFKCLSQNDFYESSNEKLLKEQIGIILEHEAPITEDLLLKRMAQIWNFHRIGEQIRYKLTCLFKEIFSTYSAAGQVYWSYKQQWSDYENFRLPQKEDAARKLEEIPVEELSNAMKYLYSEYSTFDNDDELFKLTGKGFGFLRLTAQARAHYQIALDMLESK